ncbi:hypothetical protein VTK73DRAFT_7093 [Phialemonium thermophilum]|uniref:Uncharacterized protein n=1 Tax=Phialemonium thermophilum TaxID=223376 RepID=A0ABR3XTN9_9PEZI
MSLPPSSPRLPSPPPPAEIQIGPKSPSMGPNAGRQAQQIEQNQLDAAAKRRIHVGTKAANMAAGPPLVPLSELDSAFLLQEHLAALHYVHTESNTTPIRRETAKLLATPPASVDRTLWLYELCRFLIKQCNSLIVGFLFDSPPCSAETCPEMRASEWQFLCAVHDAPKSCCAIDYCCHTLDWAANVVTNPKIFPSRFVLSDVHDRNTAVKNLVNVFRRLHRIFAHAWFQHRGVFWTVEGQTGLYVFFKTVCDMYDLLPSENYKLPPEAEGLETSPAADVSPDGADDKKTGQQRPVVTAIAKPPSQQSETQDENLQPMSRTNTRRHIRSSPSTGNAVSTVPEVDEDDSNAIASKLKNLNISAQQHGGGEPEVAEIPVIVMEDRPSQPSTRRMSPRVTTTEADPEESIPEPPAADLSEHPSTPHHESDVAKLNESTTESENDAQRRGEEEETTASQDTSENERSQQSLDNPDGMHETEPGNPEVGASAEEAQDAAARNETAVAAEEDTGEATEKHEATGQQPQQQQQGESGVAASGSSTQLEAQTEEPSAPTEQQVTAEPDPSESPSEPELQVTGEAAMQKNDEIEKDN